MKTTSYLSNVCRNQRAAQHQTHGARNSVSTVEQGTEEERKVNGQREELTMQLKVNCAAGSRIHKQSFTVESVDHEGK